MTIALVNPLMSAVSLYEPPSAEVSAFRRVEAFEIDFTLAACAVSAPPKPSGRKAVITAAAKNRQAAFFKSFLISNILSYKHTITIINIYFFQLLLRPIISLNTGFSFL